MLISICGSQGSGKSTLINSLINSDVLPITPKVIERKTARSVLKDWGMELQEVYASPNLIMKFQDELLERKYQDEMQAAQDNEVWITERTFIDLLAYTVANIGRFNEYSDWLDDYSKRCLELQTTYDKIFYLPGGKFGIEDDGVRPRNQVYGTMIDTFIRHQLQNSPSNFCMVEQTQIHARTRECALQIINQVL